MIQNTRIRFDVTDVTDQKRCRVRSPVNASVGEVVDGVLSRLGLPSTDNENRVVTYHARLDREGRHLSRSELVGESIAEGDLIQLQPDIDAG